MFLGISLMIVLAYILGALLIGWLAGLMTKGKGFGFFGNLVIAILGSIIGRFVLGLFHIYWNSFFGSFLTAVGGAVLLLFIINLFSRKK